MKRYTKSWRTTLGGLILLVCVVLYFLKKIDGEQLTVAIGVLTAGGLIMADDNKKKEKDDNPFNK